MKNARPPPTGQRRAICGACPWPAGHGMDRRLDSLRSSNLCDEAAHLCLSSWVHDKGLPQLGVLYARGNRFAASARAPRDMWSEPVDTVRTLGDILREESVGLGPRLQDRGPAATVCRQKVSPRVPIAGPWTPGDSSQAKSVGLGPRRPSRQPIKKPRRGGALRAEKNLRAATGCACGSTGRPSSPR